MLTWFRFMLGVGVMAAGVALTGCSSSDQSRSDIGRLGFIHPALPSDDPFFSQMIEKIAEVQGVRCSRSEAFGWRLPAGDQKALDDIVGAGMDALQVRGYTTQRLELPVQGVLAFDAHSGDPTAEDPILIVAWQLSASDVHLVLCRVKEG